MSKITLTTEAAFLEIDLALIDLQLIGLDAAIAELDAGGRDHALCHGCEQRVHVMDLNARGVCENCEMEGSSVPLSNAERQAAWQARRNAKLKEQEAELVKLRKENARLRRQVAELEDQLKKVHKLRPSFFAFHSMSHMAILRTSTGADNNDRSRRIRTSVEHRARPNHSA